jgi:hypothetical protein
VKAVHKGQSFSKFICYLCDENVKFKDFGLHLQTFHDKVKASGKQRRCKFCFKLFLGWQSYGKHLEQDHDGVPAHQKCDICLMVFSKKEHRNRHLLKVHTKTEKNDPWPTQI